MFEPPAAPLTFTSPQRAFTRDLGRHLGARLRAGDVLCLAGPLGAGKTAFASGVVEGWGALEAATSPTFVLIHEHRRADGQKLFHLDAYRLERPADAETLPLDDVFSGEHVVIIEWPERLAAHLPSAHLWVTFAALEDENARLLTFEAHGARAVALQGEVARWLAALPMGR